MNVILCEDVDNLGDMGETVKVAPGYARNFLIPRKLAVQADTASAKQIEHEMRLIRKREEKRNAEMASVAKKLEAVTVEFKMRAGEGEKLYGSVTSAHIAEKLAELGFEISRKHIQLPEPIKSLGMHQVPVKFRGGMTGSLKVWVTSLVEEAPAEAETEGEAKAAPAAEAAPAEEAAPAPEAVTPETQPEAAEEARSGAAE